MSKAITKTERDAMIANNAAMIETMLTARRDRDASLAEGGRKRSQKYCAFFATAKFATAATDYKIDLNDMFGRCDKTLDRFVRVFDALVSGSLALKGETDQNRYTFNLVRSLVKGVATKQAVKKTDILATATKRDDAQEFVTVSRRVMSDTTAERQSGIATYVLELLGIVTRTKNESGIVTMTVNTNAVAYKRFCKLIAQGE
jgi:hypothetical protein